MEDQVGLTKGGIHRVREVVVTDHGEDREQHVVTRMKP